MVGSIATTSIITKGLHGGPACQGIITSHFSLYIRENSPPPPAPVKPGGGGPYPPSGAWNQAPSAQQIYQPIQPQQPYIVPRDQEAEYFRKKLILTIKVKIGGTVTEKTYAVPEKQRNMVVRVFGIMETTKRNIKVVAKDIRNVAHRITMTIRNIRVKKRF